MINDFWKLLEVPGKLVGQCGPANWFHRAAYNLVTTRLSSRQTRLEITNK